MSKTLKKYLPLNGQPERKSNNDDLLPEAQRFPRSRILNLAAHRTRFLNGNYHNDNNNDNINDNNEGRISNNSSAANNDDDGDVSIDGDI